ncbi:DMT family transporter [Lacipirellula limnantheis]|uniref:Guanidinium exporter n=1 Tax=Lacipirellula limnantheis TaxID=2528024 RepID=A0A517TSL8_9BACT|nr:quaternary ammonium compound efflux SMR transporter SugE [Lacipirellula limnantheis]QDT71359.1 Quaternary ammonium compound-resistance protein SugE [Lacipirellula limnantheis]
MHWWLLLLAGLLEVGWAIGLKYTDGFTRPLPSLLTGSAIVGSMILLSLAARAIPIGTAYAVWTGIGVAGAATLGILLLGEAATPGRLFFLALLLVAVIGLKLTSGA